MKATIEGGLSDSRGDSIVVSDNRLRTIVSERAIAGLGQPSDVWVFLLHEQTHVLERKYPQLFAGLYTDVFGFRRAQVTPPEWLRLRRAINPDAPIVEWIYPLGQGAARHWILPDVELRELNYPKMPADFEMVALRVHQVENGYWTIDDMQQPAASTDLASLPEYVGAFPVKGLLFHPAEIAAEMLAQIIYGGPKVSPEHELWSKTTLWAADALR